MPLNRRSIHLSTIHTPYYSYFPILMTEEKKLQ